MDLCSLLQTIESEPLGVRYISLLSKSTWDYATQTQGKYNINLQAQTTSTGLNFIPLLFWYDKPHVADRLHYLSVVFGLDGQGKWNPSEDFKTRKKQHLVKKGDFIEDTFGGYMLNDIKNKGIEQHAVYGTWVLDMGEIVTCHLHGRRYMTAVQREQSGYKARISHMEKSSHQVSVI